MDGGEARQPPQTAAEAAAGAKNCDIPRELTELLIEYTVGVLQDRPADLVDYAIEHFTRIRLQNQHNCNNGNQVLLNDSDERMNTDDDDDYDEPLRK